MDLAKARPMLDELKKGPWPSFVKEIEKSAAKNEQAATLLDLLEDSYEEKRVHWKHGGIVGVRGYGGGVIGRYTDSPEKYPAVTEFQHCTCKPDIWLVLQFFRYSYSVRYLGKTWFRFDEYARCNR